MEKKLVIVPFDFEMAKKIASKEIEGRIITRDKRCVRVVCWDAKSDQCILALLQGESKEEVGAYPKDGRIFMEGESPADLMLEIPEYMTYRDGDIVKLSNDTYTWLSIIKDIDLSDDGKGGLLYFTNDYVSMLINDGDWSIDIDTYSDAGQKVERATEEEKQKLIDAMKANESPKAKEYLKRFFGIEEKKEYEFKPKDWVLCRIGDEWCLCRFSHKTMRFDGVLMFVTVGGIAYDQCIPYNEQTAHLIGKADDWKE
jgi:hypothetical protein|nr:MAG TPA_asm: hypothetical protein [Caudoviricetes sp.]